jgi:mRNA deadenylase 3'-5' endonuclease subunit Ccr4
MIPVQDGARRLGTVKKELTTWLPDIMCLQEVSCFHNELAPFLHEHGYTGRFIKRTGEKLLDGCALFYNHHKFEVWFNFCMGSMAPQWMQLLGMGQACGVPTQQYSWQRAGQALRGD